MAFTKQALLKLLCFISLMNSDICQLYQNRKISLYMAILKAHVKNRCGTYSPENTHNCSLVDGLLVSSNNNHELPLRMAYSLTL